MTDNLTIEQRKYNMSRIRSKDTNPEFIVRKYLYNKGLRYRLHKDNIPGKPDLVFKKFNAALFINGCFWHGHKNCKYSVSPKTNVKYWNQKIEQNIQRDKLNYKKLKLDNWNVIIIWECQLKKDKRENTLYKLYKNLISTLD
jgi:DNA mismatch endonuclease (patch repair protein)